MNMIKTAILFRVARSVAFAAFVLPAAAQPMSVKDVPADVPKFTRVYTKVLDKRATLALKAWTGFSSDRYYRGELTQPNGAWVTFDPENVAERILDPTLVPLVKSAVAEAITADRAFIASKPKSFKDEKGVTWVRQD